MRRFPDGSERFVRGRLPMRSLNHLCCQNQTCSTYGQRGAGNLSAYGFTDKRKTIWRLRCSVCKACFSERKGTVLYQSKLPQDKAILVLRHIHEGCGVRQTARLTGVGKNTSNRLILKAGKHAQQLHDELVAFSPSYKGSAT
jgi:transposase-like protein